MNRKIISLLLAAILCFGVLVACSVETGSSDVSTGDSQADTGQSSDSDGGQALAEGDYNI